MGILRIRSRIERSVVYSHFLQYLDTKCQGVDKWQAKIDCKVAHLYELIDKGMQIIGKVMAKRL